MADTLEFNDEKTLQAWLQDKPAEWAQLIALRIALRVFPLVMSIARISDGEFSVDLKQGLILSNWRALLVSWTVRKYSVQNIRAAALAASNAVAAHAPPAFSAANAAANAAARAAFVAVDATMTFADAAVTAEYAADAVETVGAKEEFWAAVSADCQSLLLGVDPLVDQALWLPDTLEANETTLHIPSWVQEAMMTFDQNSQSWTSSWGVILAWYRTLLPNSFRTPPGGLFDEKTCVKIALQSDRFWTREPQIVMDAVAEIVNWERPDKSNGIQENAHIDSDGSQPSYDKKVHVGAVAGALLNNREPLLFSLASLLQQISEFRERIRGDNQLDSDFKKELFAFLDGLDKSLGDLANLVPGPDKDTVSEEDASATATWLVQYKARVLEGLHDYCAPENVADTTLPVGIILGLGTVGALVAGPMGFGAGAFFGQLVVRHAKPGTVGDKLKEVIEAEARDAPEE